MSSQNIISKPTTAKKKLSEDFKDSDLYLKSEINNIIASSNENEKKDIERAYIIRNGKRPSEKFKYLSDAYGIQYPAKIRHIPVLKSMFDAIIAIDQSTPLDFQVTSKDIDSLRSNQEELKNKIIQEFVGIAKEEVAKAAEFFESDKRGENPAPPEKMDEIRLKKIVMKIQNNFKSLLEEGAQDMLESLIQKFELEIMTSMMVEDLVSAGSEYYQVKAIEKEKKPLVKIINPLNIYYKRDPNKKFLKDHTRVMVKEHITIEDLLACHGHLMKTADVKRLLETHDVNVDSGNKFWNMKDMSYVKLRKSGCINNEESLVETQVTLHYVEWIANTEIEYNDSYIEDGEVKYEKKSRYRKDRYEGYRVNEDIYFGMKLSDFIYRPSDAPYECFLTINGGSYNDRNADPYSLVLNTEDIADKIDVLHYLWESMVAMSGGKAALIDFNSIPVWLNPDDKKDRVVKFIGMVKQGAAIVAPNQPGAGAFNNSGQIDLSIDQSIGVILEMIRYLEEVAGKITGVSQQMLGSIAGDALKGTTQMALNQSSMVLMPFFFTHNAIVKHLLTDLLNASRLVYSNGFIGSYILGELQQKIFSIDNDKFWLADFDIWLSNSGIEKEAIEQLKALSFELVKANQIDAMEAVSMNSIKSLTKIKNSLQRSIQLKEENQVDELQQQLKQIQQEMQKVMAELEKVDQAKMRMQEREMQLKEAQAKVDNNVSLREISLREEVDMKKIDLEKKRVELEALQLTYSDNAKEIKNS